MTMKIVQYMIASKTVIWKFPTIPANLSHVRHTGAKNFNKGLR